MLEVAFEEHLEIEGVVVLRAEMLGRDENVELEDGEVCERGAISERRATEQSARDDSRDSARSSLAPFASGRSIFTLKLGTVSSLGAGEVTSHDECWVA